MRLELVGGVVIAGAGVVYASLGYAAEWSCEHAPSPTLCVTSAFPDVVAFALIVIGSILAGHSLIRTKANPVPRVDNT
jgi:hypothetical protein